MEQSPRSTLLAAEGEGSAGLSWAARLYIGAVVAVAAVLILRGPFGGIAWWRDVAVLGLLLVVFESTATPLRPGQLAWSPNSSATLAAAVLTGPVGAAIVGACTVFGMRRGPSPAQRAFNTGMMALSGYLAGWVFVAMGGQVGVPDAGTFPKVIGPFAVAAVVHAATNHSLLAGILWLTSDRDFAGRRAPLGVSIKLIASDTVARGETVTSSRLPRLRNRSLIECGISTLVESLFSASQWSS